MSWLLSAELRTLPIGLRSRAAELRDAIEGGLIKQIFVWYVHNLPSSKQVADELKTVERTARSALRSFQSGGEINVFAEEISATQLEKFYVQAERVIFVTDSIKTRVPEAMEVSGGSWTSLVTSVSGRWL